jgi:hypothetical protein
VEFEFEWAIEIQIQTLITLTTMGQNPTHTTHRPTYARPSPRPSFLFSPTNTALQPTGHGPAQPAGLTASRPLIFRPGQLTSGTRLSAFPSSSHRPPPQLSRPRSARSTSRQGAPTAATFCPCLFLFSLRHTAPLAHVTASPLAPLRSTTGERTLLFHLALTAALPRKALAVLRCHDAATRPCTDAKNPRVTAPKP